MNINIEEIMKPYFDIKEDIRNKVIESEKNKEEKLNQITVEKNILNLRLEKLRDNKEAEIEEYLKDVIKNNYNFSNGYVSALKKDLEKSYEAKENEILNQIKKYDEEIENLNNISYSDLIYEKKLPGVKEETRIKLSNLRLNIEAEIEKKELEIKLVELDMKSVRSQFYSWDIGPELQGSLAPYYNQKQSLLKQIEELRNILEIVKENQKLIFSDQELKEIIAGNVDKSQIIMPQVNEISIEEIEETVNQIEEMQEEDVSKEDMQQQIEEYLETTNEETEDQIEENNEVIEEEQIDESKDEIFENVEQLIVSVCDDILKSTDDIKKLKINKDDNGYKIVEGSDSVSLEDENIELSNGTYLNENDLEEALDQYGKAKKGRVFKVEGIENTFEITNKAINKIKKALRKRSAKKLIVENKLGSFDIKRVFGREDSGIFSQFVQIGEGKINVPEGVYINMNDFIYRAKSVIENNKLNWIKRFLSSINIKEKLESLVEVQEVTPEELFEQEVNNSIESSDDFNFQPLEVDDEYIDIDFNELDEALKIKTK